MMVRTVKLVVLWICRCLGLFWLARQCHRQSYLVLCYHGFQIDDEATFRPKLFMTKALFEQRMAWLSRFNMRVVDIRQAIEECRSKSLQPGTVAITIDDGFYSTLSKAAPVMKAYEFPSTLYVTSYYMQKQLPVFQLAVQYAFWKTSLPQSAITTAIHTLDIAPAFNTTSSPERLCELISDFGEKHCGGEDARQAVLRQLYQVMGVSYEDIVSSRMLSMVRKEELQVLENYGVDIQLHTHRHTFPPNDYECASMELADNRTALSPHCDSDLQHFCYPSGQWQPASWRALQEAGVVSAVTCDSGRNTTRTPLLALNRFLDSEEVSEIEFLAEISGFYDWIRRLHRSLRG